jgi:hypothetical protein
MTCCVALDAAAAGLATGKTRMTLALSQLSERATSERAARA